MTAASAECRAEHLADGPCERVVRQPEQAPARRVDDPDAAVQVDRRRARRSGSRRSRRSAARTPRRAPPSRAPALSAASIASSSAADSSAVSMPPSRIAAAHVAGGGRKPQDGEHEDGDEAADDAPVRARERVGLADSWRHHCRPSSRARRTRRPADRRTPPRPAPPDGEERAERQQVLAVPGDRDQRDADQRCRATTP